jgi:hypothetical protein
MRGFGAGQNAGLGGNAFGRTSSDLGQDAIPYPSEIFILATLNLSHVKTRSVITSVSAPTLQAEVETGNRSKFRPCVYLVVPNIMSTRMGVTLLRQERINILEGLIENDRYGPITVYGTVNRIPEGFVVTSLGNVRGLVWHILQPEIGDAPAGRTDEGSFPCLKMTVKSQGKSS